MAMYLQPSPPTGYAVPPNTPHSVCNSVPEWEDNVAFSLGKAGKILKETSYPRFNIHPHVKQLTVIIVGALDTQQKCFLFPTRMLADECRTFVEVHFPSSSCDVHCVTEIAHAPPPHQVFAVLFSADAPKIMPFYTFHGGGISTRLAELCIRRCAGDLRPTLGLPSGAGHTFSEYYNKYAPFASADDAKKVLRSRVSGTVDGGNIRGVPGVSPDDVYLFASGMQTIWRSHKLLAGTIGSNCDPESRKVAHVNLLYCDSYKFLELTSSAGYHFFSNDTVDELEALLATGTPENPAIMALYTDFPGNPHLRSADIARLRELADRYNFPIIVDETVAGYLNTQMLPYCDVVVSSLTKLFSGLGNVLGGAMLLNPSSPFYPEFKAHMEANYEDSYFDSDAIVMEMNSREFVERTRVVNHNAEKLSDMLYTRSVIGGFEGGVLQAVHYPKYRTRENFERCRNPLAAQAGLEAPGYGCLLSVTFKSLAAAKAFYSALTCYKGTTLGTVYTLANAFTALAYHPEKMQWLEDHGVEESLVRFSVGMEDTAALLKCVSDALEVAENSHSVSPDTKN
ncbi:pyridoxal phosphate-dependent transferase [Mycena maculata]|uniref:Pyridoxal phosphate-dependent transferase n=1 Tax=Mycena maculata TaxID=230809 RepID=A0AAD7HMN4_9AGAR|nr:pyridoxal phosphate-dependent transferase [Mycena maculata]